MNKRERIKLMGAVVTVLRVLRLHEKDSLGGWSGPYVRTWLPEPVEARAGWIVGFTHRRNGVTTLPRGDEGTVFRPTKSVPCVLVKYWPTLDAIEVPLDGFAPGGTPDNRHARWPTAARSAMKEEAKSFPRRNGRFAKVS